MKWFLGAVSSLAVLVASSVSYADFGISTGDYIKVRYDAPYALSGATNTSPRTGSGGPFEVWEVNSGGTKTGPYFWTFCIETNEYLGNNLAQYKVTINDKAVEGGFAGGSPDPLDDMTRYIYRNYVHGGAPTSGSGWSAFWNTATGGTWTNAAAQNAAVQDAIWYIENELGSLTSGSDAQKLYDYAKKRVVTDKDAGYVGDVFVMNLMKGATYAEKSQDLLTIIPEPASVLGWLGVSSVFGLGLYFRRRGAK